MSVRDANKAQRFIMRKPLNDNVAFPNEIEQLQELHAHISACRRRINPDDEIRHNGALLYISLAMKELEKVSKK